MIAVTHAQKTLAAVAKLAEDVGLDTELDAVNGFIRGNPLVANAPVAVRHLEFFGPEFTLIYQRSDVIRSRNGIVDQLERDHDQ